MQLLNLTCTVTEWTRRTTKWVVWDRSVIGLYSIFEVVHLLLNVWLLKSNVDKCIVNPKSHIGPTLYAVFCIFLNSEGFCTEIGRVWLNQYLCSQNLPFLDKKLIDRIRSVIYVRFFLKGFLLFLPNSTFRALNKVIARLFDTLVNFGSNQITDQWPYFWDSVFLNLSDFQVL